MSKKVAIYARVSTDDQAERGYSLPSQIEACIKFAAQKDLSNTIIYQDDISGVKSIGIRPEGGQMQQAINSGQIKAVIVYQIDRLSRDIVDLLTTVRDWLRAGVEIYSLDVGQVKSELDIVLVIKGWQGSDERQKIMERTSRGRFGKARAGKAVGSGPSAYGYSYHDGMLWINEQEAEVVRTIFRWYVEGDETGKCLSILEIAFRLSTMGLQTPSEARHRRVQRKRGAGIWNKATINVIIASETYCGALRYGKFVGSRNNGKIRPLEEQVIVNVPAIISRETWQAAQDRRAHNSVMAKRNGKRSYLLKGMLKCSCGGSMVGGHGNYTCSMRYNRHVGLEEACPGSSVSCPLVESLVWDYVMELLTNPERFEERIREAQMRELESMQPKKNELEHVKALIGQAQSEADDIANAMCKVKGIVAERLQNQAEEVDRRYQALLVRRQKLEAVLATKDLTDRNIASFLEFREAVATGLQNPTFEDKRRWLEILQVEVKLVDRKATISCRLPGESITFHLKKGKGDGNDLPFEITTPRNVQPVR